jgi:hypothetical protein
MPCPRGSSASQDRSTTGTVVASRRAGAVHERLAPFSRKVLEGLYPFKSMRKSPFRIPYSLRYDQILTLFRSKYDHNLIVSYSIRNRYDRT